MTLHRLGDVKRSANEAIDLHDPLPPLKESAPTKLITPAPAWVALLAAWLGLFALLSAVALPLLPGSRNPRAELTHARPYAPADRWLPVPTYASVAAIFLGCVVLWQTRREPRPLSDALRAQHVQAYVGLVLAGMAVMVIYVFVHQSIAMRVAGRGL